jgi:hypothetical protein
MTFVYPARLISCVSNFLGYSNDTFSSEEIVAYTGTTMKIVVPVCPFGANSLKIVPISNTGKITFGNLTLAKFERLQISKNFQADNNTLSLKKNVESVNHVTDFCCNESVINLSFGFLSCNSDFFLVIFAFFFSKRG